jgi:RND family efflux transporter MFP subunit
MLKILRYILPVIILGICLSIAYVLIATKEPPRQRNFPSQTPQVEVELVRPQPYQVVLKSQGIVQARTQISLVAEVRGMVIEISPKLRQGGFFEAGDLLLKVDPSDYEADLIIAEAAQAQAELLFQQEEARYEQAKTDWERLGVEESPSQLVLREPQIRQARASLQSASARVAIARRNLERTEITAPFAGRVLEKLADVGQYLTPGSRVAEIYAVDYAEVRLPLNATQLSFLDLDEAYRGDSEENKKGSSVTLKSTVADREFEWEGTIVRSDGAVDAASRQLFVIAQIPNPYGRSKDGNPPLKVGTFVEAEIEGRILENVKVIPRRLLNENSWVNVVDQSGVLRRRNLDIVWSAENDIVFRTGLEDTDRLCLTDVPFSLEGLRVTAVDVDGEKNVAEADRPKFPPMGMGGPAGFINAMLNSIPEDKPMPEQLKRQLDDAIESGDRAKIRPAVEALREWAKSEGIELPAPGGR